MSRFLKTCAATAPVLALLLVAASDPAASQDSDIAQIDSVPGGLATVLQNGTHNNASVSQLAVQSGLAPGQNQALITQQGDDNNASIQQDGSANAAEIAQSGANNEGIIMQMNSGNGFQLQQTGNGLSIKVEQYGAAIPGSAPVVIKQGN
jgi:hypothetical protein